MEIGPTSATADIHKADAAPARPLPAGSAPAAPQPAADDSVDLTDGARQLQDLQAAVAATPVVDSVRVAALRDAIANGSYRVDAQAIADGLLAQDRAALG
ncbi:flagellar biosynthesis anti-sigma factor FlgM [Immundisolibacter cernigliae]|nr:flagellar biosynthesis anti-sigma factor FlgM [Immundisolibacter cernigliae]